MTPGRCKVYVGVLIPKDITTVSQTHKEKKKNHNFRKITKKKICSLIRMNKSNDLFVPSILTGTTVMTD